MAKKKEMIDLGIFGKWSEETFKQCLYLNGDKEYGVIEKSALGLMLREEMPKKPKLKDHNLEFCGLRNLLRSKCSYFMEESLIEYISEVQRYNEKYDKYWDSHKKLEQVLRSMK